MNLKADKGFTYPCDPAKFGRRVAARAVLQFQKMRQLCLVKFADALLDVLRQYKIKGRLKLRVVGGEYVGLARLGAFLFGAMEPSGGTKARCKNYRQPRLLSYEYYSIQKHTIV